jgi:hypothetical protein
MRFWVKFERHSFKFELLILTSSGSEKRSFGVSLNSLKEESEETIPSLSSLNSNSIQYDDTGTSEGFLPVSEDRGTDPRRKSPRYDDSTTTRSRGQ